MLVLAMLDTQSPFLGHNEPDAVAVTEARLRSAIISGALGPGARLSEVGLCREYATGRGIVRAALSRLAQGGFVLSQPRSGWKVSAISAVGLREIILARGRLESLLADAPLSAADLTAMRTICDMQAALRSVPTSTPSGYGSLHRSYDRQIRDMLATKLKAPLIAGWLANLWDRSERYLNYFERTGAGAAPCFDWTPFIEAKALANDEAAAASLEEAYMAFARFSQSSLLSSELVAPEAASPAPRAARAKTALLPQPSRRERSSKRTT